MMWQKACPRCGGDLFLDSDLSGYFVSCIQCGNVLSEAQGQALFRLSFERASAGRFRVIRADVRKSAGKV